MTGFPQVDAYRGGAGLIRVIGHRGARGVMPENTLEGFRFTFDIGVDVLEFDVVMSSDGVPVITHNHALLPSAVRDGQGAWLQREDIKVADLTLKELRDLDVGGLDSRSDYGRRFPDQAFLSGAVMPTLAELCALVQEPQYAHVSLLLELKTDLSDPDIDALRSAQVAAVVDVVRAHGLTGRTALHSFDWALLDECRRQAPEMPTSYLSEAPRGEGGSCQPDGVTKAGNLPEVVAKAGGQMWCPWFEDVTPELLDEARALSLPVVVWTVNEVDDIVAMIEAGVDGIVTDYPGRVQRLLLERGLGWSARVSTPPVAV